MRPGPPLVQCDDAVGPTLVQCDDGAGPTLVQCDDAAGPTLVQCDDGVGGLAGRGGADAVDGGDSEAVGSERQ